MKWRSISAGPIARLNPRFLSYTASYDVFLAIAGRPWPAGSLVEERDVWVLAAQVAAGGAHSLTVRLSVHTRRGGLGDKRSRSTHVVQCP